MIQPVATARLRWLHPNEGGRAAPPRGSVYAPTAHFVDASDHFSVVLRSLSGGPGILGEQEDVELHLLAPENLPEVAARIVPHARLHIMEGAKTVAECELLSIRMADPGPVFQSH